MHVTNLHADSTTKLNTNNSCRNPRHIAIQSFHR